MEAVASQKRLREMSSEQAVQLEDDVVHAKKHDYTKVPKEVEAHGKDPLCVVCSSNPEEADEMIKKMRLKLVGTIDRIIGVDVEYTREDEPNQRAAVLQLCLEEMVLVFHITAATKMPDWLDGFLKEKMYTFVGFHITRDQEMLKKSGLEINPGKLNPTSEEMEASIHPQAVSTADVAFLSTPSIST
ncbi:hypothetical protein ZWY2020_049567 [Hordeum vulgare]|nr:hypothetical protein ZWY2020_049567 [Hordeum vulgare]